MLVLESYGTDRSKISHYLAPKLYLTGGKGKTGNFAQTLVKNRHALIKTGNLATLH